MWKYFDALNKRKIFYVIILVVFILLGIVLFKKDIALFPDFLLQDVLKLEIKII